MIKDKEWMMTYGVKGLQQVASLYKDEFKDPNPVNRDIATILRLQDAINFYDTTVCLMQVLEPNFDEKLKKIYEEIHKEIDIGHEVVTIPVEEDALNT